MVALTALLQVHYLGFPPAESRQESLTALSSVDYFGCPLSKEQTLCLAGMQEQDADASKIHAGTRPECPEICMQ